MVLPFYLRVVSWFQIPVICTFRSAYLTAQVSLSRRSTQAKSMQELSPEPVIFGVSYVSSGCQKPKGLVFTPRALTAHQALEYGTIMRPFTQHIRNQSAGVIDHVPEEGNRSWIVCCDLSERYLSTAFSLFGIPWAMELPLEAELDFERASHES